MVDTYILKQHDLEPSFEVQLLDDVTPVDLTSAVSVLFLMKSRKGIKATGPMTIADQTITANRGVVRYDWIPGDTDTASAYSAEIQVSWPGIPPRPQTFPADKYINVDIQKDLGPPPAFTATLTLAGGGTLATIGTTHQATFILTGGDGFTDATAVTGP